MAPEWVGYLVIGLTAVLVVALTLCGPWWEEG